MFDNLIATASLTEPTLGLAVISDATVEHGAPEWPIFAIDLSVPPYPCAYSLDDVVDLGAMAQPDWLTPGGEQVAEWARAFAMRPQSDTLSLLKNLNAGILTNIVYRVREEEGTQPPSEALGKGSGSCRDVATLFIEAARHLGFGAHAVSGYLVDGEPTEGPDRPTPGRRCICQARAGSRSIRRTAASAAPASSPSPSQG